MGQISTFGSLTQLNFNFGQVTSLNKTFGNFSFDGYYYEQINMIATATLIATPTFLQSIVLYETLTATEGHFERVSDRAIAFLFGGTPIILQSQIIMSNIFNTKITVATSYDAQIVKQLGAIGKINRNIKLDAKLNSNISIKSKIISNTNNI